MDESDSMGNLAWWQVRTEAKWINGAHPVSWRIKHSISFISISFTFNAVLSVLNLNRKGWNKKNPKHYNGVPERHPVHKPHVNMRKRTCGEWDNVMFSAVNPERRTSKTICSFHTDCFSTPANPRHPLCRDSKGHLSIAMLWSSGPAGQAGVWLCSWTDLSLSRTFTHQSMECTTVKVPDAPVSPRYALGHFFFYRWSQMEKTTTVRKKMRWCFWSWL